MSIKKRIENLEKETGKENVVFIWMKNGETEEEALKRSGREIQTDDKVYYFRWRS